MTFKEFLNSIPIKEFTDIAKMDTYELLIQHNEHFAVTDNGKTIVNAIEINDDHKTITLKFKGEPK